LTSLSADIYGAPGNYNGLEFRNGGFSLRRISKMHEYADHSVPNEGTNDWLESWQPTSSSLEDHYFSKKCGSDRECTIGSINDAQMFSCCTHHSSCDDLQVDSLLGFHGFNRGVSEAECASTHTAEYSTRSQLCPFETKIRDLQRAMRPEELSAFLERGYESSRT
jgi:hypothetical protein